MVTRDPDFASVLDDVHIVLLRPRWARNLGSVARAMKNFGLRRLAIDADRDPQEMITAFRERAARS